MPSIAEPTAAVRVGALLLLVSVGGPLAGEPPTRAITRDAADTPFAPLRQPNDGNAGLFVGVNEFTDDPGLTPLRFAVNDAVALAHLFVVELQRIPANQCCVALSGSPTGDGPRQQLAELERLGAVTIEPTENALLRALVAVRRVGREDSDLLVLSVSTHGFAESGIAYVMPADGQRDFLRETALKLTTIEEQAARSQAGHRLLLIDACQERVGSETRSLSGTRSFADAGMSAAFAAAIERPTGQAKLTSCDVGEYSYEDPRLGGVGHGVFTYAILEALRGGAAVDAENLVRLDAVVRYVEQRVTAWTRERNGDRPAEGGRVTQSPAFHGPEKSRALPLASKGEGLDALLRSLARRVTPAGPFTEAVRQDLEARLRRADPTKPEDRQLVAMTRDFAAGRVPDILFVPYLRSSAAAAAGGTAMRREDVPTKPEPQPSAPAPAEAGTLEAGATRVLDRLGMKFVWCPPGQFMMGESPDPVKGTPGKQVAVKLSRGFWIGQTEVTQKQWVDVLGFDLRPWAGHGYVREGASFPAANLTWQEAMEFCRALNEQESEASRVPEGWAYRLPYEAEWEYACRAGSTTQYCFGDGTVRLGQYCWFNESTLFQDEKYAHAVATLKPNDWGIYDMHGNVFEWCLDPWSRALPGGEDPFVGTGSTRRIYRGGAWSFYPHHCTSGYRYSEAVNDREIGGGLRVVLGPLEE